MESGCVYENIISWFGIAHFSENTGILWSKHQIERVKKAENVFSFFNLIFAIFIYSNIEFHYDSVPAEGMKRGSHLGL